jgi:hypothetical protein
VLSPIVWRHFFALLVLPVALSRPRFGPIWLVPLAFWFVPGTENGAPWQTALGLAVAAATVVLAELRTTVPAHAPVRRTHAALKPTSG